MELYDKGELTLESFSSYRGGGGGGHDNDDADDSDYVDGDDDIDDNDLPEPSKKKVKPFHEAGYNAALCHANDARREMGLQVVQQFQTMADEPTLDLVT